VTGRVDILIHLFEICRVESNFKIGYCFLLTPLPHRRRWDTQALCLGRDAQESSAAWRSAPGSLPIRLECGLRLRGIVHQGVQDAMVS
jgi:hypothetical protein